MRRLTPKQGWALAYGRSAKATGGRGWDLARIAGRQAADRRNAAAGLTTCWKCLAGVPAVAERCPACGTEQVPF